MSHKCITVTSHTHTPVLWHQNNEIHMDESCHTYTWAISHTHTHQLDVVRHERVDVFARLQRGSVSPVWYDGMIVTQPVARLERQRERVCYICMYLHIYSVSPVWKDGIIVTQPVARLERERESVTSTYIYTYIHSVSPVRNDRTLVTQSVAHLEREKESVCVCWPEFMHHAQLFESHPRGCTLCNLLPDLRCTTCSCLTI